MEQAFAAARGDSTVSADDDAALALGSALREVTLLHRRFVAIARRLHDDTHGCCWEVCQQNPTENKR